MLVPKTTPHTFASRSFSVSSSSLWNKLPVEIKGIGDDKEFNKNLKHISLKNIDKVDIHICTFETVL